MDIDEFLDKEIQEKKEDVEEKPADSQDAEEEKDSIKRYSELWGKVSEAKFKWDSSLYAEISKAGNGVSEHLSRLLPAMDRKKSAIKRLIGKALSELENSNYEAATKIYAEISDMRNSFPDFLLEQKKELNREIFLLYEKLHDHIDSKFMNDLKKSIEDAGNFIADSYSSFDAGDIAKAKIFYEKALEAYKSLPNGFLPKKIELGSQLLGLYKDLSIHTEIETLQQQLAKKSGAAYRYTQSYERLESLSQMAKNKNLGKDEASATPAFSNLSPAPNRRRQSKEEKTLLSRLIARKLDRARINLEKGLYFEARKNLGSVLSVDPENEEAKQMLSKIPVEY